MSACDSKKWDKKQVFKKNLGFCDVKIYWHKAVKPQAKVTSLITKRGNQLLSYFPVTYNRILIEKYRRASFIGLIWWFANFVTYHPKHKVSNCNRNYLFEHCVQEQDCFGLFWKVTRISDIYSLENYIQRKIKCWILLGNKLRGFRKFDQDHS